MISAALDFLSLCSANDNIMVPCRFFLSVYINEFGSARCVSIGSALVLRPPISKNGWYSFNILSCDIVGESNAPTYLVPTVPTARSLNENSAKDVSILTVQGQDPEGDALTYFIVSQTPISPPFEMDSSTGLFNTPRGLDAESSQSFSFTFG